MTVLDHDVVAATSMAVRQHETGRAAAYDYDGRDEDG
jgi:hypothetical protein